MQPDTIEMKAGDEIKITRHHKTPRQFSAIQPLVTLNSHPEHLGYKGKETDLLEILLSLSKPSQSLFILIKRNLRYQDFISDLNKIPMNGSERNVRSKASKELIEAGLIARLPRNGVTTINEHSVTFRPQQYMISPNHICPSDIFEKEIRHYWNQICKPEFKFDKYNWAPKNRGAYRLLP